MDINSEQAQEKPDDKTASNEKLSAAQKGVEFCNRLFYEERLYKDLPADERKQKRLETQPRIWEELWSWLETLSPTGGSKLEKAVNYAFNHKETLMNYLQDGRCEISNNAAERRVKSYVMGRKNFLFHNTVDGARASATVLSLIETAKANNLNVYQYLYTLLLYMPDYKNEPAGIEQLMPWSENQHMGEEMIYICIQRELARENNFKILPKHPLSLTSYQLYDYDEGFNLIDWEIMTKVGLTDDHAKRIKMAECLSDRVIPVRAFKCFYVSSELVKIYVESVLHKCGVNFPPPFVNIMPQWFA